MISVSLLNMYAEGFESLVKIPKRSAKKQAVAKQKSSVAPERRTENKEPQINYFTGANSVFDTIIK